LKIDGIDKFVVQLLPHAEHIIVLDEGRITERGSFDDLNSSNGFVSGLGLKKADLQEIKAVVAQEEEYEKTEKQIVLEKITMIEEMASDEKKVSRGKRNSSSLISYIRSMGKVYFPIFGAFTLCNIGFRSAQRKSGPALILTCNKANEISQALWLNVWTAANVSNSKTNEAYYIGVYILFGALNVVFMGLQF
jgi:ATP-binding cassette subfamily C (CFTR/MRP) protein 1